MDYIYLFTTLLTLIIVSVLLYIIITRLLRKSEDLNINDQSKFNSSIEILKLEFEYAKETAMESQRDRFNIVNFYIILFTSIFAAGLGISEYFGQNIEKIVATSLIFLAFLGLIFNLFIVRLRQSWYSSAKAMNRIKDFFIDQNQIVDQYLGWRLETLPKPEKLYTISFFSSFIISTLGTVSLTTSLILLNLPTILIVLVSVLYLVIQVSGYYFFLKYGK
jgi:hypothetical protein